MSTINIKPLLEQLPIIFEYFVPGYIFITIFLYFTSRKLGTNIILGSVAISYLLKAICTWFHTFIFVKVGFGWSKRALILIIIAIILSLFCIIISESKILMKIVLKINNKSIHDDIWSDIVEYKRGTTLRIICDDCTYTGKLFMYEEKGNDSWFCLEDYVVEEKDRKYSLVKTETPCRIAIRLADAKRIELFYGVIEKSKVRIWLENNKYFKRFFKKSN